MEYEVRWVIQCLASNKRQTAKEPVAINHIAGSRVVWDSTRTRLPDEAIASSCYRGTWTTPIDRLDLEYHLNRQQPHQASSGHPANDVVSISCMLKFCQTVLCFSFHRSNRFIVIQVRIKYGESLYQTMQGDLVQKTLSLCDAYQYQTRWNYDYLEL